MTKGVGVVGGGTMGAGIAYAFATAAKLVTVVEPDEERAARLPGFLTDVANQGVERGKLTVGEAASLPARVQCVAAVEALPVALQLVVESVPERPALKRQVLLEVEARRPSLLATNTSSLSVDTLAEGLRRPEAFLGMHFFNPVWAIGLVELVRGTATAQGTVDAAGDLVAGLGKQSIVVRDVPGFATSRLDLTAALEAMRMLEDGVASAEDIDRAAVLAYRHPVGPLRLSDIVGLDVRLDIARHLEGVYGERYAPPEILVRKVQAGELGQKSGRGFFCWD